MELHQLQYVVEVAKQKNFTRAADTVNVSQSTLSQQIAKLEDELGVKLFERNSRTVSLTQVGEEFINQAKILLGNLEQSKQIVQEYKGLLKGTLRIGAIASLGQIGFANLMTEFYRQYPGIKLEIVQAGTYELLDKLAAKTLEMAFVVMPGEDQYPDISFRHLLDDDYVLALPPSHRLAGKSTIDLAEIARENFVFHPATDRMFFLCLDACAKAGFKPNIVCESNHSPTCLSLISAGMGIGFFPVEKIENTKHDIAIVRIRQPLKKDIVLAVRKEGVLSPVAAKFHGFVQQWIDSLT
ncbi:MAG: LysR family transcriptional regulator [Veillonellaceae bacterium]|nr:LysR family transcriptional regulator [Veillonellaceae bacterium]